MVKIKCDVFLLFLGFSYNTLGEDYIRREEQSGNCMGCVCGQDS